MNDRRSTDERIADVARELYHAPPATPSDEMWSAIEARLAGAGSAEAPGGEGTTEDEARPGIVRLDAFRSRLGGRAGWWIGIAAALVVGLGIGRLTQSSGPGDQRVAAGADAGETVAARPSADVDGTDGTEADVEGSADRPADPARPDTRERLAGDASLDVTAPKVAGADGPPAPPEGAGRPASRGQSPYAVATREHLDRTEILLAGVRTSPAPGVPNPEFESWARSLLTRTRLLMASPAGRDPATRRLLEDVELMLAQIAVAAATGDPAEARILDRDLEEGDLLYRLRSATENENGPGRARISGTSSL